MDTTEGNEAPEAVETTAGQTDPGTTLPSDVQAPAAGDQAAGSAVNPSEIAVGNQKFRDVGELAKAYENAQRGFTQKTQEHSRQMKAYESLGQYLKAMQSSPERWKKFISAIEADKAGLAPQGVQAPQQPAQGGDRVVVDGLSDRIERAEAQIELQRFQKSHPDVTEEQMERVFDLIDSADQRGERWNLEVAYRYDAHEQNAAKLVSEGQKKAEQAMVKSRQATALGSAPTSAAASKPKGEQPWHKLQGAALQNKRIAEMLDKAGIKFDEDV